MTDSNTEQKRALECLRLASELMQLSRETLNPLLKAYCVQMAGVWNDQAVFGPLVETPARSRLLH
jgi:hypothetical protein